MNAIRSKAEDTDTLHTPHIHQENHIDPPKIILNDHKYNVINDVAHRHDFLNYNTFAMAIEFMSSHKTPTILFPFHFKIHFSLV